MKPQTVQIFLSDGLPTSIKKAELTNRLIKTIWFPRTAKRLTLKVTHYADTFISGMGL